MGISAEVQQDRVALDEVMAEVEELVMAMGRLWTRVQVAGLPD